MQIPGRRGSFFSPGVARLYAESLDHEAVALISIAADATDRQYVDVGGGMTHGLRIYRLTLGLGLGGDLARGCGTLIDALQIAVDMADNLADEELDQAHGRCYNGLYADIPADCRPALPALMVGAVVTALFRRFPPPRFDAPYAAERLMRVLGLMTTGQGRSRSDPLRIDHISGEQGRLYALPLWVSRDGSERHDALLEVVETWGFEFGRTWQLQREVIETTNEPHWTTELERAEQRAMKAWPGFPPFTDEGLFSKARMRLGGSGG